jgi:hypothetical protein
MAKRKAEEPTKFTGGGAGNDKIAGARAMMSSTAQSA